MRRHAIRVIVYGALTAVVIAIGWFWYDRDYRIPAGPTLPPAPPERTYAKEVIDLNNRGVDAEVKGNWSEALGLFDQAIAKDQAYFQAYSNKAMLLVQKKRYQEALDALEKLSSLKPRMAECYVMHAWCLTRVRREGEARQRLMYALSAYNARVREGAAGHARLNRAVVLYVLGRKPVARREVEKVLEAHRDSAAGRIADALRQQMTADPADPWSILGLGD